MLQILGLMWQCKFILKTSNFKMLVAFLPIFVTDTKITFVCNFVTSLNTRAKNLSEQFKRWMASKMCCLEKPLGINMSQRKEWDEHLIIYNVAVPYGTDMKPRLNRYWWKWGKNLSLSIVIDLLTFFYIHKITFSWHLPIDGNFFLQLFY